MQFVYPYLFWILLVPFVVMAWWVMREKEHFSHIFAPEVLKRLRATKRGISLWLRKSLMLVALFLMIVALARPVVQKENQKVKIEGLTLLTALDISGSMRSKDIYPNRLTFAKKKMMMLFDALPSDKIGIMAFAYSSFVLAPFSSDKETLKMMLDGVDDSYINMGSTDFSALGAFASTLLEGKKPKILVLFSDGGDKEALQGFKEILKKSGIDLYVVLVGTKKGAPVLDEKGKTVTLKDNTIAMTQRNDSLGDLAKSQGGAYVIAGNGREDMEELAAVIHTKYQQQDQGEVEVKQMKEYFYYPLGLGVFFLLLSLSSMRRAGSVRRVGGSV